MARQLISAMLLVIATAATGCAPPQGGPGARDARVSQTQASPIGANDYAAAAQLDFGPIPLGASIPSLPLRATLQPGCDSRTIQGCSFDLAGITYGTDWEHNIVVIKTIHVGDQRPAWLPFNLRGDEMRDEALVHLNAQLDGAFEIGDNEAGEQFLIASSGNARVEYFEVSMRFARDGRLSEIRASCCYN